MDLRPATLIGFLLASPAGAETWAAVSAIFAERCTLCHSGPDAPLGLSLDSHAGVMAGSENGPVATPDGPLMQRITGAAEPRMPLDGPPFLDDAQIAAISAWIGAGAPGPAADSAAAPSEAADPEPAPDPRADGRVTFNEVERIFKQRCIECHSDNGKMQAPPEGLRLTSLEAILAGGDRIVVVPGNAQASEIIRRVEGLADPRMPLDGPPWLDADDIALLRDWIAGGAKADDGTPAPVPVGGEVRLRGIMTAPDAIDGAGFTVTGGTRIDDRPAVGEAAELRGRIAPDGSILAERLRDR